MIDVLKIFYSTHYNFGAISILLLLLFIFLLTKKNVKFGIVVLAAFIALNVFIYKRTDGYSWTITIDPPQATVTDSYGYSTKVEPTVMTFSVHKDWTITDEKGEVHHWCWVDDYWDKFANTDIVAAIWGDNASKKLMKSSEGRAATQPQ